MLSHKWVYLPCKLLLAPRLQTFFYAAVNVAWIPEMFLGLSGCLPLGMPPLPFFFFFTDVLSFASLLMTFLLKGN